MTQEQHQQIPQSSNPLDSTNSTPMRPEPGTSAPWYRTDRDFAHVGFGLLQSTVRLLPPPESNTALYRGSQSLGVDNEFCLRLCDVFGRGVRNWFLLPNGEVVNSTPRDANSVAIEMKYKDYDAAMAAAGWYELSYEQRFVLHAALGEVLLPYLFYCLRSEPGGSNVPTPEQLSNLLKLHRLTEERANTLWSRTLCWLRSFAGSVQRRIACWWTSKRQGSA